ncbi:4-(cytidine 5'-diphospho)-2-C-methyl-D-erythritol kinase [Sediminicurvatus halobius]|uniref:4-diphosphocytidyl-2-C-methyl-D-erythritol kinase n=1 Tax=Sediminicurvatus halobius TaxID=2182432 RepID=A0A2U2N804_9GAMM|nr:4-(cytidine 5'-diphospho)-2-C-methyl-D-erythritol kinase [Spiribacter halobius]PWG65222.1 4-(cytidine 5'-diphospho)-2-C-methyl-D-erythritol kinase [Spiribacter halobius]UEX78823.1 4-(cytidine 5'-diphospho)-2-C-methyl-D-erythritol kinase [Spiribacter halobius]
MSAGGWWPAPAKINRFLHVTGRRPDGYHELQTLFQFVEPVDWLAFEPTRDGRISRRGGLTEVAESQDLVVRAARLLQAEAGVDRGVRIHLRKRIPAGAGLGGGSSDAATTLVALDRLWGLQLGSARLAALGLRLGADVPVFVHGRAAWAEGVGERLTPLTVDEPWLLLADPGVPVATGAVFADRKLTRSRGHITIRALDAGEAGNDCEPVVRRLYPEVARMLDALARVGEPRLTGTGGCAFVTFGDAAAARAAQARLGAGLRTWVSRAVNRSPLRDGPQGAESAGACTDHWGVAKR